MRSMWYLYMLLCDQTTFYVGITSNVPRRLEAHEGKQSFFTKKFSKLELVHCEWYSSKVEAAHREKQIKGWSVAKKRQLVSGELGVNSCPELVEEHGRMRSLSRA